MYPIKPSHPDTQRVAKAAGLSGKLYSPHDRLDAAMADIDAQFRRVDIRPPEQRKREFIAHHVQAARELIAKAKARRQWLRKLAETNPGAVGFYPEHLDLLAKSLRDHRAHVRRAREELRALAAQARMAA
jgi:hypothetical protein